MHMKTVNVIAKILLIIGGLNWLLVGVTSNGWDVGQLFGGMDSVVARVIYILVGISAIIFIFARDRSSSVPQM